VYKVIVVGTDGSPGASKALEAAAEVARSLGARLHVVTAYLVAGSGIGQISGASIVDTGGLYEAAQETAKAVGDRAIAAYGEGLEIEAHVVNADAVSAILDTASAVGADLVVVGSRGMKGVRRVLGSVPNSVAHAAGCAVLIAKTQ
jgi:nucleotide-binding universal stress UspA family protein